MLFASNWVPRSIVVGVIDTFTVELPTEIEVVLAKNPLDVAFIVPTPKPVLALTWPVIVAPALPVIKPDAFIVLAETTNLPIVLPNRMVFDVGAIAVVFATNPVVVKLSALTVPV